MKKIIILDYSSYPCLLLVDSELDHKEEHKNWQDYNKENELITLKEFLLDKGAEEYKAPLNVESWSMLEFFYENLETPF